MEGRAHIPWNWAEMDSDVMEIILIFGANALLAWKEMYRKAHMMRETSFASSAVTIFNLQEKNRNSPCFNVQEYGNDRGKWHLFLIPRENFGCLEANGCMALLTEASRDEASGERGWAWWSQKRVEYGPRGPDWHPCCVKSGVWAFRIVGLKQGDCAIPGDIWQRLETFLMSCLAGGFCWHLRSQGQGCS